MAIAAAWDGAAATWDGAAATWDGAAAAWDGGRRRRFVDNKLWREVVAE
jgi:hypothetical protein